MPLGDLAPLILAFNCFLPVILKQRLAWPCDLMI